MTAHQFESLDQMEKTKTIPMKQFFIDLGKLAGTIVGLQLAVWIAALLFTNPLLIILIAWPF